MLNNPRTNVQYVGRCIWLSRYTVEAVVTTLKLSVGSRHLFPPESMDVGCWWFTAEPLPKVGLLPKIMPLFLGIEVYASKGQPSCLNPGSLWRPIQVSEHLGASALATVSRINFLLRPVLLPHSLSPPTLLRPQLVYHQLGVLQFNSNASHLELAQTPKQVENQILHMTPHWASPRLQVSGVSRPPTLLTSWPQIQGAHDLLGIGYSPEWLPELRKSLSLLLHFHYKGYAWGGPAKWRDAWGEVWEGTQSFCALSSWNQGASPSWHIDVWFMMDDYQLGSSTELRVQSF